MCITGDINSRTSENLDYVCNINLDRYVDLLEENVQKVNSLPTRRNQDKHVNMFGTKLLTLCKENSLVIVNGRLEPGFCTFRSSQRNGLFARTVDYLLTGYDNYKLFSCMNVFPLQKFSDQCPVVFTMSCSFDIHDNTNNTQYDRLDWDSTNTEAFLNTLNQKSHLFKEITDKLANDEIDVNNVSELIYNASFQHFGRTVPIRKTVKKR